MPLDLVSLDGVLQQERLDKIWAALKTSNADAWAFGPLGMPVAQDGFMVDVWWGITEPEAKSYRFAAYKSLMQQADEGDRCKLCQAKQHGFKAQVVSSFHQCGNNVGWATRLGAQLPFGALREIARYAVWASELVP